MFDFACNLSTIHTRELVGQTLTHHAAGIDKDLASLLHSSTSDLPVYLYSHEARNVGRIQEFLQRARRVIPERVSLLRLVQYPSFDADIEAERIAVAESIRDQVFEDLLMNVLFGRLRASDISIFLEGTGIPGLLLSALESIALHGFINYPTLGRALNANTTTLRPRVQALLAAGMLSKAPGGSVFCCTPRAGIFLRICSLIASADDLTAELAFILGRLDLDDQKGNPTIPNGLEDMIKVPFTPIGKRTRLLWEIYSAQQQFGAALVSGSYLLVDPVNSRGEWIGR